MSGAATAGSDPPQGPDIDLPLPMGAGGYRLGARLAVGGMAELFLGERLGDCGVRHPVVIKRLREEMRGDRNVVRMFEWEAWISSRLRHPHIVRFHDLVVVDGRRHLVLEYLHGLDLARLCKVRWRGGEPFPLTAAVEVALAVAGALEHAHALRDDDEALVGLVHRDVSPHNVVLSTAGEVKIIDFGVAKTTSFVRDTGEGLIKGKLGYHAPEQLRGDPIDGRSDLFGLGVILWELVAGRHFFEANDGLAALLRPVVPDIRALRPECPDLLEQVISRALAPTPSGRFGAAGEMAAELRHVRHVIAREGHDDEGLQALVQQARGAIASAPRRPVDDRASRPSAPPPAAVTLIDPAVGRTRRD